MGFLLPKVNFDDINKFEVSFGILLLLLSAASFIFEDTLQVVPLWIRIAIAVFGLAAITRGLCQWSKRQDRLDEKLDLEIMEKKNKLHDANQKQIEDKVTHDAENFIIPKSAPQNATEVKIQQHDEEETESKDIAIKRYLNITHKMYQHLSRINNPYYTVLKNKSIQNIFFYNLIYKSQKNDLNDRIVEVIYCNETGNDDWIGLLNMNGLEIQTAMYRRDVRRSANLVLVIVYNTAFVSTEQIRNKIKQQIVGKSDLLGMQIFFVKEDEIDKFDANIIFV